MSDLVERLAEKWAVNTGQAATQREWDARWWLNAIADELEKEFHPGVGPSNWLRSQAQVEGDDG